MKLYTIEMVDPDGSKCLVFVSQIVAVEKHKDGKAIMYLTGNQRRSGVNYDQISAVIKRYQDQENR